MGSQPTQPDIFAVKGAKSAHSPRRTTLFGFSPWFLLGIFFVLGIAVLALSLRNSEREQEHIISNYMDRADALIWALEAGTRTGMGFEIEQRFLQPLVKETANQPGILYIAVIDADGQVLAHSDQAQLGTYLSQNSVPDTPPTEALECRVSEVEDEARFVVWRGFAPLRGLYRMGPGHGSGHGRPGRGPRDGHGGMGHGGRFGYEGSEDDDTSEPLAPGRRGWGERGMPPGESGVRQTEPTSYAVIAFDKQPLKEALAADRENTLFTAFLVVGFGLAGFVSLFWANSYQTSRRKLKDTEALASEVFISLPLGLVSTDPAGRIRMANEAASAMLKKERLELIGQKIQDVPGINWAGVISGLSGNGRLLESEMELEAAGARISVSVTASRICDEDGLFLGHIFLLRDIEEVKRLQSEVQKNERLKALGSLAAGVAHEIRNPLSSIKGLATFLAQKAPSGGAEEEAARTMVSEADRLNRVVTELLEFARPESIRFSKVNVNNLVAGALRLAEADVKAGRIQAKFYENEGLPEASLNPERMTQALLNLFLNAAQATSPGGRLEISVEMGGDGPASANQPGNGEFAIVVSDTGRGIPEDVLGSIFTPYFTTKPSGTGLGLAIVHQIVEGHGGRIHVQSTEGVGSVFKIILPLERPLGGGALANAKPSA